MITIEKADSLAAFEKLEPDWNTILESSDFPNIFTTFDWLYMWWKNYGAEKELYILVVRKGSAILGIAPFMRSVTPVLGRRVKRIQFIGTPDADYSDILATDKTAVIEAVFDHFANNTSDWSEISLTELSERSETYKTIKALTKTRRLLLHERESLECLSYIYDGRDQDRGTFSLPLGKTNRKKLSRLRRQGHLEFRQLTDAAQIKKALPTLFHYHINRWHDTPIPSKFLLRKNCAFYEGLVDSLAPQGRATLFELCNNAIPIAHSFCFTLNNVLYGYTMVHNVYFSAYSPGRLLIHHIFNSCFQSGYKEIDFSRGAEQYKFNLTNRTYTNHNVSLFRHRSQFLRARLSRSIRSWSPVRRILRNRRIRDSITRVRAYRERHDSRALLRAIARRVVKYVFDYRVLLMFQHKGPVSTVQARCPIEIRELGIEDIDLICSFLGCTRESSKYSVILERFRDGGRCYTAFCGDAIGSICWGVMRDEYFEEVDWHLKLESDEVFLSDAFTSPVFRGKRIFPALRSHVLRACLDANYKVFGACMSSNIVSYKGIRTAGYTFTYKIRYLKVLGIRVIRLKSPL